MNDHRKTVLEAEEAMRQALDHQAARQIAYNAAARNLDESNHELAILRKELKLATDRTARNGGSANVRAGKA